MKLRKLGLVIGALMISLSLQPTAGWASRAVGGVITGEITASPSATQIEIGHHLYRIKADSPAAAAAHSFYFGELVDVTLDKPAMGAEPEVVSITQHAN
ncbi:MAG TPA: hypothetical protein VGO37_21605 [Steroidobacteraceae bacterium]|jgi:hypothetical protein|nr:hypothetical protein [Steroidobacteraceae bacterium]